MEDSKKCTYTLCRYGDIIPKVGEYFVYAGKKGVGGIWMIKTVREVKLKKPLRHCRRFALELTRMNELREFVVTDGEWMNLQVWIKGVECWVAYAIPWKKKKPL